MRSTSLVLSLLCLAFLLLLGFAGPAAAADKPTAGLRYPSLTPDNKQVVFAYRGDIWIAPVDGKKNARRLTIHEAQETLPKVSPDGKQVAFISQRNGGYDVYVMSIDGGLPKKVTHHSAGEVLCDWSPDGKRLLVMTMRHPGFHGAEIYEVDLAGGTPRRVTRGGGREGSFAPDGKRVVFARGSNTIHWDNYEGSANYDLFVVDEPGALERRLTDGKGNERWPFFSADGKTVYFVAEEKGLANMYAVPSAGGERKQVTKFKEDIWRPDLAWDGKTLVFEQSGKLFMSDLTAKEPKATPMPVVVNSDVRHSGIEKRLITTGPEQVDLSPGGMKLAFAVHGDIWTMDASGGRGKRLTSGKSTDMWPRFSPDGRHIAYVSDKGGDQNIWLLEIKTGQTKQLTRHRADDFFHSWSPAGDRLVFCSERSGNKDLWSLEVESGKLEQLTRHPAADDDPAYSPDGEWIAFDSAREGSQAIYVMPASGGEVRRVTTASGFLQVPSWSPDSSMLVYEAYNPTNGQSGGLFVISARGGPADQLTRNGSTACWSPKGDYIFYTTRDRNGKTEIQRIPAPTSVDRSERIPFAGEIEVDRRNEFGDLFDEVWTRLKEGFYDPKMHGVDWDAMKKKYRPLAVDGEIKAEFQNVMNQMLAELGASHLGLRGGREPEFMARPEVPDSGFLGLEFEPKPLKAGGMRVMRILRGGPADKIGLRVGDVVTKLGGKKLTAKTNLDTILTDAEGKELPISFRPAGTDGSLGAERRQSIKAAPWRELYMQTYRNWVEKCAETVKEKTKGKAGYIHLQMMNGENLNRFRQAVSKWNRSRKIKGMVLDVRFNGGGNIHIPLMQILTAKPLMQFQARGGPRVKQPELYWDKPVIVLINERSFSDAEVFPDAFRSAKIGKIVGVPTAGGVIGTNDITLSDGSTLRIPRVGYYSMDGTRLEGKGVQPDVFVMITPEDSRAGLDPQLDRAIELLMADIEVREKEAKEAKAAAKAAKAAAEAKEKEKAKPATEKPTTEKPTTEKPTPASTTAPKTADAKNPLADVEVGEWVRYRCAFGTAESVFRYAVTEVKGDVVRFETTVEKGGEFLPPLPAEAPVLPILDLVAEFGPVRSSKEGVAKVGATEAAILTASFEAEGMPIEAVFTNAVPGIGLWKASSGDDFVLEAVAWGSGPESAAEPAAEPAAPAEPTPTTEPTEEESAPEKPTPEAPTVETPATEEPTEEEPDGTKIANPLYDAEVGEWVRFKQSARGAEVVVTVEVVEVTDEEIVLQSTVEIAGRTAEGPEMRQERKRYLELPEDREIEVTEGTTTIDDQELTCIVLKSQGPRGADMEQWICPEVPVMGLVKIVRNGRVMQEILAWGTDGAPTD